MTHRAGWGRAPLALLVACVVMACDTAAGAAAAAVPGFDGAGRLLLAGVILGALAGGAAWVAAPRLGPPAPAAAAEGPPRAPALERRLADRLRFDRQLDRALEAADDERAVFEVAARALDTIAPSAPTEVMMAARNDDPSNHDQKQSRMVQVAEAGPHGEGPGCPVAEVGDCQAVRRGRMLRFEADDAIDACPHLHDRLSGPCSAVCVPVRVLGRPAGVIHRIGSPNRPPDDVEIGHLESLATKLETRLGLLRISQRSDVAALDPVTGMFRWDALETKILDLARTLSPFALAQCDIDGFGSYVEAHGDVAGNAALRLLSQCMLNTLRPGDLVGRYGLDELLVVFPATTATDARGALERVRERLALALVHEPGGPPPFTCSFGVVDSGFGRSLDDLLVEADVATSLAKDLGRNRVVVAGELVTDPLLEDD